MANLVIEHGRLTADPEIRQTTTGVPVTSFSIAVPRRFKKDETDFLDVVAWRKAAEFVCQYFTKGKWIEVVGELQTRTYTDKEGKKRKAVEIVADQVNFVGNKPKDEETSGGPAAPPPPPGVDPFAGSGMSPSFDDISDDGDLPF